MKTLLNLLSFLVFLNITAQNQNSNSSILLEDVTIINPGIDNPYIGYILLEDSIIKKVSKIKPQLKKNTQSVNLKGKYIIPGLIDAHVHISGVNGFTDKNIDEHPEIVKAFKAQLHRSYLYFGYTTLIDLSTPSLDELDNFKKTTIRPNLYHVGSGAVIGKGYGITNWNDETPNFIYVENEHYKIPKKYNPKNHTVEAVVDRIKSSGAIGVKTYYEPGFNPQSAKMSVPTPKIMHDLYLESHKKKLLLIAHANSIESHGFLANYKVDIMAHGLWRWGDLRLNNQNQVPKKISNILDLEIKNGIAYTPTLQVINGLKAMAEANYLKNPDLTKVLPDNMLKWYKNNSNKLYAEVFGDTPKDIILKSFNRINKQGKAALKYMFDNNGFIVFGTDTPSSLTYGNPPGYNGYLEMKSMHDAGISLKDILKFATINNATILGLQGKYGSIETGKIADLVILNKNPLKSIEAYNNIDYIVTRGKLIKREQLQVNTLKK